jgi:sugar lactone lactonase YvrE
MLMHNALAFEADDDLQPILVRADPNGLAYDRHTDTLFVADGYSGAILRIDGPGQRRIATIDSGGGLTTNRIGGLAITPYGTLFVTRLGYGAAGTIFRVEPDGQTEALEKLPARYWRLGVTYDPAEHALYATQYLTSKHGAHGGEIVVIDLVTGEPSTILDGFARPIGIVKLGATLVVADARQRAVFRVDLVAGRAVQRLQLVADIGRPDSLCGCSQDSVLVTSYDEETERGSVRRLWLDGRTRGIASGPWEPRGVATDGHRVFVASRRSGRILVFPV